MAEDPNRPDQPRRIHNRFKPNPKAARRIQTPIAQNDDNPQNDDAVIRLAIETLGIGRRQPEVDTKSSAQVAFGPGPGGSSSTLQTYGSGSGQSSSTSTDAPAQNASNAPARPLEWNLDNPPILLPWRKPNSEDPGLFSYMHQHNAAAILDEVEFGEAASKVEYDENTINPAEELGLLALEDKIEEQRKFLVQLPPMPLLKEAMSIKGKEKIGTSTEQQPKLHTLKDMPEGYMGKMLVYKSGAVKLKLGETLFDVSPGTKNGCDENIISIDTVQRNFCNLGRHDGKMVITPDIDSMDLDKDLDKVIENLTKRK